MGGVFGAQPQTHLPLNYFELCIGFLLHAAGHKARIYLNH
jgi:hypothetical protein